MARATNGNRGTRPRIAAPAIDHPVARGWLGMTGPKSLEEEISELKAADKVDEELEAMKAALRAKRD